MMSDRAMDEADELDLLTSLVRRRRSNLHIDVERRVDPDLINALCDLSMWAPNHKRTSPWRFAAFTGAGRERLGAALAEYLRSRDAPVARISKADSKYLRAPVILVVGSAAHDDPVLHAENRDAVAAGVMNLLLGATAMGLASFWSTGEATTVAGVKTLCGFEQSDQIVAIIYLGWPDADQLIPAKQSPIIVAID